jgi:hypothetical protein
MYFNREILQSSSELGIDVLCLVPLINHEGVPLGITLKKFKLSD